MDCLFCKIIDKRVPSTKVYEDDQLYAFRDVNPQAPIHILVIPRKHVATINDLDGDDASLVGKLVLKARDLAREEGIAEKGYRLVMNCNEWAGQSVFHVHLHLLSGRAMRWPPG